MTIRQGNVVMICEEPTDICSDCGKIDELRPYGPNFSRICYDCGQKDLAGTNARMLHLLFDEPLPEPYHKELVPNSLN